MMMMMMMMMAVVATFRGKVTVVTESRKNSATTLSRMNFSNLWICRTYDYYLVECLQLCIPVSTAPNLSVQRSMPVAMCSYRG